MEAKDTLPPAGVLNGDIWCPACGYEFSIEGRIKLEREAQAEITWTLAFKAGVRAVGEWAKRNGIPLFLAEREALKRGEMPEEGK